MRFFVWMRPFILASHTHSLSLSRLLFLHLWQETQCTMCTVTWYLPLFYARIFFFSFVVCSCFVTNHSCNMVLLYLLILCLLFYHRILMNAFNMFFVSFVMSCCCFFFLFIFSFVRYAFIHVHTHTPHTIPTQNSLLISFPYYTLTHNDVFLTIERKQITQKSIIEHVKSTIHCTFGVYTYA